MMDLLLEKYPALYFQLAYSSCPTKKVAEEKIPELSLENIEILYIYGTGLGASFFQVQKWLEKENARRLVFLEDDMSALQACFQGPHGQKLLGHPQVVFAFLENIENVLEECATKFPVSQIHVTALESYAQKKKHKFSKMRLLLLRKSAALHALFSEALFSSKLVQNLAPNLARLPHGFYANNFIGKYAGVPAIICGAGPSLQKSIEHLKTLENKALILAGGSAIPALLNQGVTPHLAMAFDPNHEELLRFHACPPLEIPLVFGARLHPDVLARCTGPIGYLKSDTGGPFETWMEEKLQIVGEAIGPDLGREAFSVTTIAIAFAYALGCNPIILEGVDLAYTQKKRYAEGVVASSTVDVKSLQEDIRATERVVRRKDQQGKMVATLVKWVMESECIGAYACKHPERLFLNATQGGIGCPGMAHLPLEKILERYCVKSFDLRKRIAQDIRASNFTISSETIDTLYQTLIHSLERCLTFVEELCKPDISEGKKTFLQFELEQEEAYDPLLGFMVGASQHLFKETSVWPEAKKVIQELLSHMRAACSAACAQ